MDTEFNFLHVLAYCVCLTLSICVSLLSLSFFSFLSFALFFILRLSPSSGLPAWPRVTTLLSDHSSTQEVEKERESASFLTLVSRFYLILYPLFNGILPSFLILLLLISLSSLLPSLSLPFSHDCSLCLIVTSVHCAWWIKERKKEKKGSKRKQNRSQSAIHIRYTSASSHRIISPFLSTTVSGATVSTFTLTLFTHMCKMKIIHMIHMYHMILCILSAKSYAIRSFMCVCVSSVTVPLVKVNIALTIPSV